MAVTEVRDNPARSRFELLVSGSVIGVADYQRHGDRLVLPHTEIDPSYRGRGFAAQLASHALDSAREQGLTVVPQCWYIAGYIRDHSEYADLVEQ